MRARRRRCRRIYRNASPQSMDKSKPAPRMLTPLTSASVHLNETRIMSIIRSAMEVIITIDESQRIAESGLTVELRCSDAKRSTEESSPIKDSDWVEESGRVDLDCHTFS